MTVSNNGSSFVSWESELDAEDDDMGMHLVIFITEVYGRSVDADRKLHFCMDTFQVV